jgi:hypothetical protein
MYAVGFHHRWVLDYLAAIDTLSQPARVSLIAFVEEELGEDAGSWMHVVPHPPDSEGWGFVYTLPFRDGETNRDYRFRFICDARHHFSGVIRVLYVDYTTDAP